MRQKFAAGNWKMNLDLESARTLVSEVSNIYLKELRNGVQVVFTPSYPYLYPIQHLIRGHSNIFLAAQNMHQEEKGAYTGEVSADMLKEMGCEYVILGHSERRQYFGENSVDLELKMSRAMAHGIRPIFCLGETLEQREAGVTNEVVQAQLQDACFGFSGEDFGKIVVAYEPIWAIGTGKTATPEQAQEVHAYLRSLIAGKYGDTIADSTSILYGGSVKPANAAALFAQPDIDGGLVGGASLKSRDFVEIIRILGEVG